MRFPQENGLRSKIFNLFAPMPEERKPSVDAGIVRAIDNP